MLEVFSDAFPSLRKVAVLTDRLFNAHEQSHESIRADGRRAGIAIEEFLLEEKEEFDRMMASRAGGFDGFVVPYTKVPFLHSEHVVAELRKSRKPSILGSSRLVRAGGLMAFEPDYRDSDAVLARQIEAIAMGMSPALIPVERSRIFRLTVNLAAASAMGLKLPAVFVKRADVVLL